MVFGVNWKSSGDSMTRTLSGNSSNRMARWIMPASPTTSIGGNGVASIYNFAMISGPIPAGSPIVIAIGNSSNSGIVFHLIQCIGQGSLASEAARLGHQRQREFTQDAHYRDSGFDFAEDL